MAEVPLGIFRDPTHRWCTILHSSSWDQLKLGEILHILPVHTCP